jgi:diguanylate cyclase (GGDEF)-like protein/PAS domain S-box-containing protein
MFNFKARSIKQKLMITNLFTVTFLLVLVFIGLIISELVGFKKSLLNTLTIQAKMIGNNSTAALSLNDPEAEKEILFTSISTSNIVVAIIYREGRPFARYQRDLEAVLSTPVSLEPGQRFGMNYFEIVQPIRFLDETIGTIYIRSDLKEMYSHFLYYTGAISAIMTISLSTAFILFSRFQKGITGPINDLSSLMREISRKKDYSLRSNIQTEDEFGVLAEGFNGMLAQIQRRDLELERNKSDLDKMNEDLREREEGWRKIFEEGPLGIALIDLEDNIIKVNPMLSQMLGYTEQELTRLSLVNLSHPDEADDCLIYAKKLIQGDIPSYNIEKRYVKKDGTFIWVNLTASLIREKHENPLYFIAMMKDITEQRMLYDKMKHDASHDGLTNLSNKTLFLERLEGAISHSKRENSFKFAILYLDLDRFKNVNDSFGHVVGDHLLQSASRRIRKSLRAYNTLARLGGDEFAVLLEDVKDDKNPVVIAERIRKELEKSFRLNDQDIFITSSIGIVLSSSGLQSAEEMIRDADIAMYQAKLDGRNRYVIYNVKMHERIKVSLRLESDLRHAIEKKQFLLHYQPIISVMSGELVGFESLVRWQLPSGELVPPIRFIPVAEETGLIVPIGRWIFNEACRQARIWQEKFSFDPPLTVSINLSSKQMKPDLIREVSHIIEETGVRPEILRVEITESIIMENPEVSSDILLELKKMNIKVYFDDFGTGYSSLSYIHKFHMDALKIDRSFVSTMCSNSNAMEIVKSVIAMAHSLKKFVIAEGVETAEQLEELKKLNCEYYQGYFYSKPLDVKAAEALLKRNSLILKKAV